MPALTRWMVRTSLVYLLLALLAAVLLALRSAFRAAWVPVGLSPVYFHLFLLGWVSQLIFGVVFWMFPKYSMQQPRGQEWLGWATYGLINAGLALRVVGETAAGPGLSWLLVISAGLQWLGGLAFVVNTWSRVKVK